MVLGRMGRSPPLIQERVLYPAHRHLRAGAAGTPASITPPGRAGFSPSYLARSGRRGELRGEVHGAVRNRWSWWRGSNVRGEGSSTDHEGEHHERRRFIRLRVREVRRGTRRNRGGGGPSEDAAA